MCDEKLKHLLDVRTSIIICFDFPIYFNTNMYENIHKILEEFYIPGPNNNNYLNIQNLEQNISYFGNIPLWHFVQFLMDHKVMSHPIAFQRINAFTSQFEYYYYLAMLWHYGEDWKFISLQLYATEKFAFEIYNRITLSNNYRNISKFPIPIINNENMTSSKYYKLIEKLNKRSFQEIMIIIKDDICRDIKMCALYAQYLTTRSDFNFEMFQSMIYEIHENISIIFLQFCQLYNVVNRTVIIKDDKLKFYIRVLSPVVVKQNSQSTTNTKTNSYEDFCKGQSYSIIQKIKQNNSILYQLIMRNIVTISPYENKQFLAFCQNIFLMSPKAFTFCKNFLSNLFSVTHIKRTIKPIVESYVHNLTYCEAHGIKEKVYTIMELRLTNMSEENICYAAIGGDAAAVIEQNNENKTKEPKNLYCFQFLPLDYNLPTFPIQYQINPTGTCSEKTLTVFNDLTSILNGYKKVKIIFKTVDGETKMNPWFSSLFIEKNEILNKEHLNSNLEEILHLAWHYIQYEPWPVSDLIHLFKCARAHCLGHLICIDPYHFICINMDLMREATGLITNLRDKSTQARMNDQYALELFSYEAYINLLAKGRYEAAFYILPFMALNECIRNSNITRKERLLFCDIAFRVFRHHYYVVESVPNNGMFTQRYNKNALGTLFGEKIFIQRCLCTTIGIGVALELNIPRIGLDRIGTHCIECGFGIMRILQRDVNTVERAIKTVAKTCMLIQNNYILQLPIKINTRENNGGVKIQTENEVEEERLFINPNLIITVNYNLMINAYIESIYIESLVNQLNSYTKDIYFKKPTTKYINHFEFESPKPYSRYLAISAYRMSTTPIPKDLNKTNFSSPINFYYNITNNNDKQKLNHWQNILFEFMKFIEEKERRNEMTYEQIELHGKNLKTLKHLMNPSNMTFFIIEEDYSNTTSDVSNRGAITQSYNRESSNREPLNTNTTTWKTPGRKQAESAQMLYKKELHEKYKNYDDLISKLKKSFDEKFDDKMHELAQEEEQILNDAINLYNKNFSGLEQRDDYAEYQEEPINLNEQIIDDEDLLLINFNNNNELEA